MEQLERTYDDFAHPVLQMKKKQTHSAAVVQNPL